MNNSPVLYVDACLISRLLNCVILRDAGFEVVAAQSFTEACRMMDKHAPIAALVTEIDLGGEPDGFELARRARRANDEVPIVYLGFPDLCLFVGEGPNRSRYIPGSSDPGLIVRALDELAPLAPAAPT